MTELVPLDFIWVDRAKRQRRELRNIPALADSITRVGRIIHPPTVERSGELRAGERRWEAAKLLGWTHIEVSFVEDMSEIELQLLELEENVGREDLPWQDECLTVHNFHQLQLQIHPDWTQEQTAERLGMKRETVKDKLGVARELLTSNTMVKEAPLYSTARNITQRKNERAATSTLTNLALTVNPTGKVAQQVAAVEAKSAPILHADFHEWSRTYTDPQFNFIHCDFPYGINADKHDQGQAKEHGGYEDTAEVYWTLLSTLESCMSTLVADSAHLMFWFSMNYYTETKLALEAMGWKVNPMPLIWTKSDGSGILPDPNRGGRQGYETCFHASRGDRKIVRPKLNWYSHPGKDKSIHMSEKPVPMLAHFMEMFVDDYTVLLDPTCGSGNSLKAGAALGAHSVFGLEMNEEFYTRAKENFYAD
jgi:ParB-like chromosome segregation protein Spo0J